MTQKLSLRDPPRCRTINGRPVSCRTCRYVMDPKFPLVPAGDGEHGPNPLPEHYEVVCCRESPPETFNWMRVELEPFCGKHAPSEGDVETAPHGHETKHEPRMPVPVHVPMTSTVTSVRARETPAEPISLQIPSFGAPSAPMPQMDTADLGSVSLSLRPGRSEGA